MTTNKHKGIVHVVTGFKEPTAKYKALGKVHKTGWDKPLSTQVFKVNKEDTIIGFSAGAVIACLTAQKYGCRAILCSMTNIKSYDRSIWLQEMSKHLNKEKTQEYVKDAFSLKIDPSRVNSIVLAGELEKSGVWKADLLVPKTGHVMNRAYINAITKLL